MLLLNGCCRKQMKKLQRRKIMVDAIVTDPPYHLQSIVDRFKNTSPDDDTYTSEKVRNRSDGFSRLAGTGFMGKEWDGGDIAFDPMTWSLCLGLLKPGGHLIAFSASRNYHRMAVAIEDAGFEIRDQIMWIYGSGFPKSHNIGKQVDKIQGNEREIVGKGKPMSSLGVLHDDSWESDNNYNETKGDTEWEGWGTALKPAHEPIVLARKPISEKSIADNVLEWRTGAINIDGCRIESDDVSVDRKKVVRKSRSDEGVWTNENSGMKAEGSEFADADPRGRFPSNLIHNGIDTDWARYFYCPKVSKTERNNSALQNTHPTVKPVELMKYLCRLVTPKGGTVLDPFMGSGSTGMAAKDEGFDFIGIEKEKEYYEIAEARIKKTAPLFDFMT